MWIGTIPQIMIGIAVGEVIGRLIFFQFRCTWITNVAIVLSGLFVIILMTAVRETATSFTLPHAGVSGIAVSYIGWLFFRMYARKRHGTEPQFRTAKDYTPPTDRAKTYNLEPKIGTEKNDRTQTAWPNGDQLNPTVNDTGDTNIEDKWYITALEEVEDGNQDKALWARALSQNQGSKDGATATYIDFRVAQLRQEFQRKNEEKLKQTKEHGEALEFPPELGVVRSGSGHNRKQTILVVIVVLASLGFIILISTSNQPPSTSTSTSTSTSLSNQNLKTSGLHNVSISNMGRRWICNGDKHGCACPHLVKVTNHFKNITITSLAIEVYEDTFGHKQRSQEDFFFEKGVNTTKYIRPGNTVNMMLLPPNQWCQTAEKHPSATVNLKWRLIGYEGY